MQRASQRQNTGIGHLTRSQQARIREDLNKRDVLLFELLLNTGCQLQEIVLLRQRHIKGGMLLLGKSKKQRLVSLSPSTNKALRVYLHELPKQSGAFLFSSRESPVITTRRVEQILAALGRRTIGQPLSARLLRATSIFEGFLRLESIDAIEKRTGLQSVHHHLYKFARGWQQ